MPASSFAVFILSYGRPDNVKTVQTLARQGYTGRVVIIVDDTDKTVPQYKKRYGSIVYVFDKVKEAETTDLGDNFPSLATVLIARNACYGIAEELGLSHFMVLDDDYQAFEYRYTATNQYWARRVRCLDSVFAAMLEYVQTAPIDYLCMLQGGDFIGGSECPNSKGIKLLRKAMNSFLCTTSRPVKYLGRMNDDVNTYVVRGSVGALMLSTTQLSLVQGQTQQNTGGLTAMYLELGTYVKSFYSVMMHPSSVKINTMGWHDMRLHHLIDWKSTVPMIVSEEHRKPRRINGPPN